MDVSRIGNDGYTAPAPPPPAPGSGEFNPVVQETAPAFVPPSSPAAVEFGAERAERSEGPDVLQRAVGEINSTIAIYRRHLSVRMHEPTNRRMVTVYDSETNEAIREIPPERVLDAHASILELVGLFVDSRG